MQSQALRLIGLLFFAANLGLATAAYGETNCWGIPLVKDKLSRTLKSSRCEKPIFYLTQGEVSRNIRSYPGGLRIVGKMSESGDYSLFESDLIVTHDDGQTYWAFGEAFSERNPQKRIKGWVEVGNTKAIKQYDNPGSNDLWYKF